MTMMEPLIARVPYMVSIGNHGCGVPLAARFHSPTLGLNWYSFSYAFLYIIQHDFRAGSAQHSWLVGELSRFNRTEHRFIIVTMQRQIYSTQLPTQARCCTAHSIRVTPVCLSYSTAISTHTIVARVSNMAAFPCTRSSARRAPRSNRAASQLRRAISGHSCRPHSTAMSGRAQPTICSPSSSCCRPITPSSTSSVCDRMI